MPARHGPLRPLDFVSCVIYNSPDPPKYPLNIVRCGTPCEEADASEEENELLRDIKRMKRERLDDA